MSKSVICIGATLIDELYFCKETIIVASSNPAQKTSSIGGVISNIVQHLALLDVNPSIITAIGNDADGSHIQQNFKKIGIEFSESIVEGVTGKYVSILNSDGNLYVSVCEDNCSNLISVDFLESKADYIKTFDIIIIDTNLDKQTIQWIITFANTHHKLLIIEPVSVSKASKLNSLDLNGVFMITPNFEELEVISNTGSQDEKEFINNLIERGIKNIWLRKGAKGSVMYNSQKVIVLSVPSISIIDSTGAGDAALAGWVFGFVNDDDELSCLQLGHTLALEILKIKGTVDLSLNSESIYKIKKTYYNE